MAFHDRPYYGSGGSGGSGGGDWAMRILRFLNWSAPIGTYFGVRVRVHITFIILLIIELLVQGNPMWTLRWGALLFLSVLLHEFGHVFGCRSVGGSATDILMWPLGGLASVAPPRRPWPEFVTVACGPLVNVVLAAACALTLWIGWEGKVVSFNPLRLWDHAYYSGIPGFIQDAFVVNYILLLFNLILVFYPFDGGRLIQIALWTRLGYDRSMQIATSVGMLGAVGIGLFGLATNRSLLLLIGVFGFITCYQQKKHMAHFTGGYGGGYGGGEDWSRPAQREGFFARMRRARAERAAERKAQQQSTANAEIDRILKKVSEHGLQSLTDKEKRTLQQATEDKRAG